MHLIGVEPGSRPVQQAFHLNYSLLIKPLSSLLVGETQCRDQMDNTVFKLQAMKPKHWSGLCVRTWAWTHLCPN